MKQLLIRADDIGYSYAVNLGIARSVYEGLVRSVGLMPNMPEAVRGWEWVKNANIAIGQHTNLCLGTPCADPWLIPSLLDKDGQLKRSRDYRSAFAEGREIAEYDELVIEIEAQLKSFRKIVGRSPGYFEAHAVMSTNLARAIHDVAEKYGLKEQITSFDPQRVVCCGQTDVHIACEDMLPPEQYDPESFVHRIVESMSHDETYVLVFHPGYLDAFLLGNSSLTVNRTKEVDALIDPNLHLWLEEQPDLRLIDYRDL